MTNKEITLLIAILALIIFYTESSLNGIGMGICMTCILILMCFLVRSIKKSDLQLAESMRLTQINRFIHAEKKGNRHEMMDALHVWSCICPCACEKCQWAPQCTSCKKSWGWNKAMKELYQERGDTNM